MNKIEPQYVTFTQAKLLKEKGLKLNFCREVFYINPNKKSEPIRIEMIHDWELIEDKEWYSAPEVWQVVEWLRLKHNIDVHHVIVAASHYGYNIFQNRTRKHKEEGYFLTPQEAYLAAFDYILKELI